MASINASTGLKIGSGDKSVGWFIPTLENLTEAQKDLLENYSHVAPEQVVNHVLEVRDRAWEVHPYPCIGLFKFLELTLSRSESYPKVLNVIKAGGLFLDLGCCFGQDLRKLVYDGAPSENLWGAELQSAFIDLGYELFLDKEKFKAHFIVADIFDDGGPLQQLDGKLDIINASRFLHLFDLDGQIRACERLVKLLKPSGPALIVGLQVGRVQAFQVPADSGVRMYQHNVESFENMWKVVGEKTGTKWAVKAQLNVETETAKEITLGISERPGVWKDYTTGILIFEVKRLDENCELGSREMGKNNH